MLQKAMALLGRALPDLTDQEETTFGAETTVWSPCSSPTERPRGPVTSREIFSDPLVAIHQQLQAAKVSCVEYFKQLDHDQDGRLGPEELQSCLSSLGPPGGIARKPFTAFRSCESSNSDLESTPTYIYSKLYIESINLLLFIC